VTAGRVWQEVGEGVFRRRYPALADRCRRVLAGELAPEEALRRGPYPAETMRMALERVRATTDPIDSTGPWQ